MHKDEKNVRENASAFHFLFFLTIDLTEASLAKIGRCCDDGQGSDRQD